MDDECARTDNYNMANIVDEDYDYLFKIVLSGDTNVGKTHLVQRYIKNSLPRSAVPTIGVEFGTRVVSLSSGATVKAQIWDTAGQERYRAIVAAHYRRAVGALLVYDITESSSFSNAAMWINELKSKADPKIAIMLVGNKLDLVENNPALREVTTEDAQAFAKKEGLLFTEASAISNVNVKQAFEILLEEVANRSKNSEKPNTNQGQLISLQNNMNKTQCC